MAWWQNTNESSIIFCIALMVHRIGSLNRQGPPITGKNRMSPHVCCYTREKKNIASFLSIIISAMEKNLSCNITCFTNAFYSYRLDLSSHHSYMPDLWMGKVLSLNFPLSMGPLIRTAQVFFLLVYHVVVLWIASHKNARQKILSGCENKLLDYQSLNSGCGGEETLVRETTIDVLLGNLPSENGLI